MNPLLHWKMNEYCWTNSKAYWGNNKACAQRGPETEKKPRRAALKRTSIEIEAISGSVEEKLITRDNYNGCLTFIGFSEPAHISWPGNDVVTLVARPRYRRLYSLRYGATAYSVACSDSRAQISGITAATLRDASRTRALNPYSLLPPAVTPWCLTSLVKSPTNPPNLSVILV